MQGDGSARRSYLYGSDAAWWVLAGLVIGKNGATYNIGSPSPVTHSELISLICERASISSRLNFNNKNIFYRRQDDLYPDTTLIYESLGVKQVFPLSQAIDRTWEWNKKQIKAKGGEE